PASAVADSEKYLALSKVEMLQLLGDAEFWELVGAASWTRRDKGSAIVREDARGRSFYFLARGEAKVTKKGRLLSMIHEGECFGEMAYIRGGEEPREATVEATTAVVIAEFEPEKLEALSESAQLHLTRALDPGAIAALVGWREAGPAELAIFQSGVGTRALFGATGRRGVTAVFLSL